jgi:hypothetical protein
MVEATLRVFRHTTSILALVSSFGLCLGRNALAQEPAPDVAGLQDLRRLIDEQRTLLERQTALALEQQRLLEDQAREITDLRKKLDETNALALASRKELAEMRQKPPEPTVSAAVEQRLAQIEHDVHKLPELTETTVTAGEFPGSFRIPGTDAALRIGGLVRWTTIKSLDALGTDDKFVTSSIPVAGTEAAGKGDRVTYSARPSRFNFDLRTPTGVGAMRAFIEGDYAGSGNTFRLRHAYGQWRKYTLGQTWSTFSDPEAEPDGIDFEGLNAISLFRQAQIRWTQPFGERLALAIAAENPAPDISAADGSPVQGVNQAPDVVVRLRWTPGERTIGHGRGAALLRGAGHTQLALLFRQVRGEHEPNATLSTQGFGYHLSGRIRSPWRGDQDRILFATAGGWGIGRYITDLGSLGGQDAVYDPATNTLEALPVASGYVGYEHWWSRGLRSTATWGTVYVENLDVQTGDALHRTDRATLNLSWSPIPRIDLVSELQLGRRINKDGQRGEARQIQIGMNFRF